jgi:hypothetical protein
MHVAHAAESTAFRRSESPRLIPSRLPKKREIRIPHPNRLKVYLELYNSQTAELVHYLLHYFYTTIPNLSEEQYGGCSLGGLCGRGALDSYFPPFFWKPRTQHSTRHLFQFPGAYINETDRIFCCNQSFWPVQIERLTQNCELFPTGCWSDLCFPRWFLPIQFSKLNREKRDSSS